MKEKLAEHDIGKAISFVLSLPGKAVNGAFKLCGVELDKGLKNLTQAEKTAEINWRAAKSRRSAIEVAFMCIAGFLALAPVWYLENHREGFLNKVDNWLHPNRTPEEKQAAALKPGDEPKETWWNLIRARLVALVVVFGIDQVRDNVDSILRHNHKIQNKSGMYKNIDTEFGWKLGDKIYERFGERSSAWIAKILSGNKVRLSAIQDETREDILEIINAPQFIKDKSDKIKKLNNEIKLNHHDTELTHINRGKIAHIEKEILEHGGLRTVERAVFAEQARMFITKEFFLTTILSIVIYAATKWPPAHKLLSHVGLKKKGHDGDCHDKNYSGEVSVVPGAAVISDTLSPLESLHKKEQESCDHPPRHADKHSAAVKKQPLRKPAQNFTEKLVSSPDQHALQMGM
ncbi:MAG: hypothetical protein SFW63_06985 [Alphaproteobacteria bacterium]|nr:hypothetical protein [Alphaproteobacteria bacterium]